MPVTESRAMHIVCAVLSAGFYSVNCKGMGGDDTLPCPLVYLDGFLLASFVKDLAWKQGLLIMS